MTLEKMMASKKIELKLKDTYFQNQMARRTNCQCIDIVTVH